MDKMNLSTEFARKFSALFKMHANCESSSIDCLEAQYDNKYDDRIHFLVTFLLNIEIVQFYSNIKEV